MELTVDRLVMSEDTKKIVNIIIKDNQSMTKQIIAKVDIDLVANAEVAESWVKVPT